VAWISDDTKKPADESVLRNPSSTFLNPPALKPQRYKWLKYLTPPTEDAGCTWHKLDTWQGCNACCSILNETLQQACLFDESARNDKLNDFAERGLCSNAETCWLSCASPYAGSPATLPVAFVVAVAVALSIG